MLALASTGINQESFRAPRCSKRVTYAKNIVQSVVKAHVRKNKSMHLNLGLHTRVLRGTRKAS